MEESNNSKKRLEVRKSTMPYGGLETLTDEEILENIRKFPYVMSRLRDC